MEISKSETLFGNLIDVWRADFTAEAAYIGETQVIGDDDEEVGSFSCHCYGNEYISIKRATTHDRKKKSEKKKKGKKTGEGSGADQFLYLQAITLGSLYLHDSSMRTTTRMSGQGRQARNCGEAQVPHI
jgi:hypothetical protein